MPASHERDHPERRLPVLFIAGSQRSGSTLLDRYLGASTGAFSAGELRYLWINGLERDELCGCGRSFSSCDHWAGVLKVFGERLESTPSGEDILRLQHSVDRMRYTPLLASPWRPPTFNARRRRYAAILQHLLRSMAAVAETDLVIDSSKDPSHGYVLAGDKGIELHVVHLVRDSRAVAYSWTRHKHDPARKGDGQTMPTERPVRTAAMWVVHNLLALGLGRLAASYQRIRYEDFAEDPHTVASRLLTSIDPRWHDDMGDRTLTSFPPQHTVSGNPMRFTTGPLPIAVDTEWKDELTRCDRWATTALTWPLLVAFGYRVRP